MDDIRPRSKPTSSPANKAAQTPTEAVDDSASEVPISDEPADQQSAQEFQKSTPPPQNQKTGTSKAVWIVLIILSLLVGGGIGYLIGTNTSSQDDALQQQVTDLNNELMQAKETVGSEVIDQKDSEIEKLTEENEELQKTVEEQEKTIEKLQEQIDESSSDL